MMTALITSISRFVALQMRKLHLRAVMLPGLATAYPFLWPLLFSSTWASLSGEIESASFPSLGDRGAAKALVNCHSKLIRITI